MTEYLDAPDRWDGSRVVEADGELAALCFATRRDEVDPAWGQLDYVCVRPGHRGAGLAFRVCAAVLQYQHRRGYPASTLTTLRVTPENLQLAAIKTYLSLGFLPVMTERNQKDRRKVVPGAGLAAVRSTGGRRSRLFHRSTRRTRLRGDRHGIRPGHQLAPMTTITGDTFKNRQHHAFPDLHTG